jgi:MFS family permease
MPDADAEPAVSERRNAPLLLLSLACYVVLSGANSFVGTVTQEAVQREFGVTVGEVSAVLGGLSMIRFVMVAVSGPVIDLLGPSAAICASLGLLSALCFALALPAIDTIGGYYVIRAAIALVAPFGDQPAHICLMGTYFRSLLGVAISAVNSGYSIAGATFPVALAPLVVRFGWRSAWLCLGALCLALALIGCVWLRAGPIPVGSRPTGGSGGSVSRATVASGVTVGQAVRAAPLWCLLLAAFLTMYWEGSITTHLLLMLTLDAGKPLTQASAIYSLQYALAVTGKLSCGFLVGLLPRRLLFTCAPLAFCASHFVLLELGAPGGTLAVTHSLPRLLAFAGVYGLSFGLTHSLITMQPAQLFGRVHLPYFQTMLQSVYVIGSAAGQVGTGWAYDASGSYALPLQLTLAASVANMVLCQLVGCAQAAEDEGVPAPRKGGRLALI